MIKLSLLTARRVFFVVLIEILLLLRFSALAAMEYSKFIRFLNPNDTCAPGEVLKGEVVLTLEKQRKFKGIRHNREI